MKCTVDLDVERGAAPLNLGCGVCGGFGVFSTAIKRLNHKHMVNAGNSQKAMDLECLLLK